LNIDLTRLLELPARLDAIERRLEEITGFFAQQAAQLTQGQTAYLGDFTALTRLQSGHIIYVDTRSVDIASHLIASGSWEPQYMAVFQRCLRPGQTVFDIGANHGVYALLAASQVGPAGRVVGFEPNPKLARLATQTLLVNGFGATSVVHQLAVGDVAGAARLSFDQGWSGGGHIEVDGQSGGTELVDCRIAVIDELFPDPAFRVDVIKMDVEGFEGRALRGMRALLARSEQVKVMLEFAPEMLARAGVSAAETIGLLVGLGFRFWSIQPDGSLAQTTAEHLSAETAGIRNILVSRQDVA
jgi:FkbM family methyltransferase